MHEGFCPRCKVRRPIAAAVPETTKSGRPAVKGRCPECGSVLFKILGSKADPAEPESPPVGGP